MVLQQQAKQIMHFYTTLYDLLFTACSYLCTVMCKCHPDLIPLCVTYSLIEICCFLKNSWIHFHLFIILGTTRLWDDFLVCYG